MTFNVSSFKEALKGEGARNTLFEVMIPSGEINIPDTRFLCKAASLPASTIGMIEVPYFGRKIKVAGDRTFADWTTTIINLEDFEIRDALMSWMNQINRHEANIRNSVDLNYKKDITVTQYKKDGGDARVYTLVNCWPAEVAAIDVDWNNTDTIEDFTVTWHYDYWVSNTTGTPA
jgi:hypothetical protein